MTSGFQDVFGLSWRLAVALSPKNKSKTPAELSDLINGWERERKSQIKQALDWTMKLGDIQNEANPMKIFVRDWFLWSVQQIPIIRDKIQSQAPTVPYYDFETGMAFLPDLEAGKTFARESSPKPVPGPPEHGCVYSGTVSRLPQTSGPPDTGLEY